MRTSIGSVVSAVVLTAVAGAVSIDIMPAFGQGVPPAATQERQRPLPGERVEARLAYLKTALKITPAQEQQWSAVADVLRRHARDRDAEIQQQRAARQAQRQSQTPGQTPGQRPQQSAIERLQQQQQRLATAAQRMNELVAAAQPLYASFSDDQKKVADEMLTRGGRRFGRGRWR